MTGADIAAMRKSLGITQAELAALVGVHYITIAKQETGRLVPTPFQEALYQRFAAATEDRSGRRGAATLGREVKVAMAADGVAKAIYMLLEASYRS